MPPPRPRFALLCSLLLHAGATALAEPGSPAKPPQSAHVANPNAALPPPTARQVDFVQDIQPLFEVACVKCHAKGKDKGGFVLETREQFLKGGETGAAAVVGKSGESLVVELVASSDSGEVMPKKGSRWTTEQVGLLRAWIDQGAAWPEGVTFAKPPPENLSPRVMALPEGGEAHPVDRLLAPYFAKHGVEVPPVVEDRVFARRAYLDLVGLLPTPEQLDAFLADAAPDKRATLVRRLLADRQGYAEHWITFWNDLLRNDYRGIGFIDGGRKQISGWLYTALATNKPYDRFVAELLAPSSESEGFTSGILWRGNVPAAMRTPLQAAQSVSQVFMGVNLKCASCHDSFVNDWSLADAFGMAAVYSDEALELVHCDKPTGQQAAMRFLYPQLGTIDAAAPKTERLRQLAKVMTSRENGRLARTIVNRFWARLLGRGLVEPLDDMEKPAWNRDVLDWLAEDLVAHDYDLQHTLEMILTSCAYQLPTVEAPREKEAYVFGGPQTRRLSAEQYADALSALGGEWAVRPSTLEIDFAAAGVERDVHGPQWIWTDEPLALGPQRDAARAARAQLDDAMKRLADAQTKADAAATSGGAALEPARVATEQAAAAVSAAAERLKNASKPLPEPLPGQSRSRPPEERHRVAFRKTIPFPHVPTRAYAVVLASQGFELRVNGKPAPPAQRSGRVVLYNLAPLLTAGENVIAVEVSSHTEKALNDTERKEFSASARHLNTQSGVAFYARCEVPGVPQPLEISSDATWRVRRSPEGGWPAADFTDATWAAAVPLPPDVAPIDEGPSLPPVKRKDFANIPIILAELLPAAVSTAAHAGKPARASLLAADPLQLALDRPNREVIVPARANAATTIQALELTNGSTLDARLQSAAARLQTEAARDPAAWLDRFARHAFSRPFTEAERTVAIEMLGTSPSRETVADFLWAVVNHPEFQLIN